MRPLQACIEGVGVLGPGLGDWPATVAVLTGAQPWVPARTVLPVPAALPATERRRAGRLIRLALAVGAEAVTHAGADAARLPNVFSSSGGDGETLHSICEALAGTDRLISPTRFHNSVHNAASGYWGIAHGCTEASSSLCGFDASFGVGLIEAAVQLVQTGQPVLLVAYDADYPAPLFAQRPIPDAFGIALVLSPTPSARTLATIRIALTAAAADRLADPQLEGPCRSIPAARGLPLLERLARRTSGTVVLDYLDTARLGIEVRI